MRLPELKSNLVSCPPTTISYRTNRSSSLLPHSMSQSNYSTAGSDALLSRNFGTITCTEGVNGPDLVQDDVFESEVTSTSRTTRISTKPKESTTNVSDSDRLTASSLHLAEWKRQLGGQ